MVCPKCDQELKEGTKFCTKCGTSFKVSTDLTLPVISIALSVIGIIGYVVIQFIMRGNYLPIYFVIQDFSLILPSAGILIALISQSKQKSQMGFIAGLIPCVFFIIVRMYYIFLNIRHL